MKHPMVRDWTSYFSFRAGPKSSPALPDSASSDLHMLLHVEADVCRPLIPYCLKRSPRILLRESLSVLPTLAGTQALGIPTFVFVLGKSTTTQYIVILPILSQSHPSHVQISQDMSRRYMP